MKPTQPFITLIPANDRSAIAFLALYDIKVSIRRTSEGWRYDVRLS
jgi:hypothetical protein